MLSALTSSSSLIAAQKRARMEDIFAMTLGEAVTSFKFMPPTAVAPLASASRSRSVMAGPGLLIKASKVLSSSVVRSALQSKCSRACGLSTFSGFSPRNIFSKASAITSPWWLATSNVLPAQCGVEMTFGWVIRGWSKPGGSCLNVSRAAPPRCPDSSAAIKAGSSTRAARAVLINTAPIFILQNCAAPNMPVVSGVTVACKLMKSLLPSRVSRSTNATPARAACSFEA